MVSSVHAMEDDSFEKKNSPTLQKIIKNTKKNIIDNFFIGKKILYEYREGKYTTLIGLGLESALTQLAGTGHCSSVFAKSNGEFDERTVKLAATNGANMFFDFLIKKITVRDDIHGFTIGGEEVTIYDKKKLLGMLAERVIPKSVPFRDVAISILNTDLLEKHLNLKARITTLIVQKILELARGHNTSIKQEVSEALEKAGFGLIKSFTSSFEDFPGIKFFWPYLEECAQEFLTGILHTATDKTVDCFDTYFRNSFVVLSVGSSSSAGYKIGQVVETIGSFTSPLITYIGTAIKYGSVLPCGVIGGFSSYEAFDVVERRLKYFLHNQIDKESHRIFPITQEKYVKNNLNPNPHEIERGLFLEDYELRDKPTSQMISSLLEGLEKAKKQILSLVKKVKSLSVKAETNQSRLKDYIDSDYKCPLNEREKAMRRLCSLPKEEQKELFENIQKYPSHDMKIQMLEEKPLTLEQERIRAQKVVKEIDNRITLITAEASFDPFGVGAYDIKLEEALRKVILNLSVEEQDLFVKLTPEEISKKANNFIKNAILIDEDQKPQVENIKSFLEKMFIDEESFEIREEELGKLQNSSLTEGSYLRSEYIFLHKRLTVKKRLEEFLEKQKLVENFSEDEDVELIKKYYIQLMAKQRAFKLCDIFNQQLEECGVTEEIKTSLFEKKEKSENISFEEVRIAIGNHPIGMEIHENITKICDTDSIFQKDLQDIYRCKRESLFQKIASDLSEKKVKTTQIQDSEKRTLTQFLYSKFTCSPTNERHFTPPSVTKPMSVEGIETLLLKDEEKIKFFLQEDEVCDEYRVGEMINSMNFGKSICSFEKNDFVKIKDKIVITKIKDNDKAYAFFAKYKKEVLQKEKNAFPSIFSYELCGSIESIRKENEEFLRELFEREKK